MVFGVVSSEGHIIPPHIFEVGLKGQHQSVPGCAEECGDPLVQSGGRWQTLSVAAGPGAGRQVQRKPRLNFRRSATTFYPSFPCPPPSPTWTTWTLLRLVIRREHHQHDLPQHQSQPDRRHPPSIRRTPTGACRKGMLPIPDPYQGGNWGWRRRLHWIDVSSTT